MRIHRLWLLGMGILMAGSLEAQVAGDPVVERWLGLAPGGGKVMTYTGTVSLSVGGVPLYNGPTVYRYQVYADSTCWDAPFCYTLERRDSLGFSGFNYTLENRGMRSVGTLLLLTAFPFLDALVLNPWYEIPVSLDTLRPPVLPDTLSLVDYLLQASPLALMLDPLGVYGNRVDSFRVDSTTVLLLILEGMEDTAGWTPPPGCVPQGDSLWRYHLVVEDTVDMWDGSRMNLRMDRWFWMIPGCFVVRDSVFRVLSPLVGKAQSQTYNGSILLDDVTAVGEGATPPPARLRLVSTPDGRLRVEGLRPGDRIRVWDMTGRRIRSSRSRDLQVPPGVFWVEVYRASGERVVLKGIALR